MMKLSRITKAYNKGRKNELTALCDIDLEIQTGELAAIVGRSGAGKSTLLHVLSCADDFDSGVYDLDGIRVNTLKEREKARLRGRTIGIVMQDFVLIDDLSVGENVEIPLIFAKETGRKAKIEQALDIVGISELKDKSVKRLSGGQKQRAAIARAIVCRPAYILADEPTGALDVHTAAQIMDLFIRLNQQGATVVIVTHEPAIAGACKRLVTLEDGKILSDTPV